MKPLVCGAKTEYIFANTVEASATALIDK
jgi:hypothetical protein